MIEAGAFAALKNDRHVFDALFAKPPENENRYQHFSLRLAEANAVLILPCHVLDEHAEAFGVLKGIDVAIDISHARWKLVILGEKASRISAFRCAGCREDTTGSPCSYIRPSLADMERSVGVIIVKLSRGQRFCDLDAKGRNVGYIERLKACHECVMCRVVMRNEPWTPPTKKTSRKMASTAPHVSGANTSDRIPKRCSQKCHLVPYCSTHCALAHWEEHKVYCPMLGVALEHKYDLPHLLQFSAGIGWSRVVPVARRGSSPVRSPSKQASKQMSQFNSPKSSSNKQSTPKVRR
jgi:hypothetical protein